MTADVANWTPDQMAKMSHADLYNARRGQAQVMQAMLAPYEHRAAAREATQQDPMMALSYGVAAPGYQIYKALGFGDSRSGADLNQLKQAYIGIIEGLLNR
jgi:hypothetical protein